MIETEQDDATRDRIDRAIPGLRIRIPDPSDPWALIVESMDEQVDWIVHQPDPFVANNVVDTTIVYRNRSYRIREVRQEGDGWVYRMIPWPDGEPRLNIVELEKWTQIKVERQAEREELDRIARSGPYEYLYGWLPARRQERLSEKFGFDTGEATRKTGLLEFFVCVGLAPLLMLLSIFSGQATPFLIVSLGMIEGATRWAYGFCNERALGLFALEIVDRIFFRRSR